MSSVVLYDCKQALLPSQCWLTFSLTWEAGTSAASCPVSVPFCISSLQQAVKSTPRPAF